MTDVGFCRQLNAGEPLAGTASDAVTRWVLLEDSSPWGAKTPKDSGLPGSVIEWLLALDAKPGTRVLLIRRPGSSVGPRRRLILAEAPATPAERRLVELELELDELPGLDLDARLASAPRRPTLGDLWLVCTHGTRDRCCAKWGMPLFEALRRRDPDRVWQCSHLGGHRFAPTFLTLPDGLLWGRFDTTKVDALAEALAAGRLTELGSLRGRSCYPRSVQAAECLLRLREGIVDDAALELVAHEPRPDGAVRVEFDALDGRRYGIDLASVDLGFSAPPSCGDAPEPRKGFRLI